MIKTLIIDRMDFIKKQPYKQEIIYEPSDENETIATALRKISESEDYRDINGKAVEPVDWECSCLQKKCGACAMVINSKPMLACAAGLKELPEKISVEPLRKFKRIADLRVDRTRLRLALNELKVWIDRGEKTDSEIKKDTDKALEKILYDGSRCLQCGICLEVCPNYYAGGSFYGMAGMVPDSRVLIQSDKDKKRELKKDYKKHIYEGCGKSLACRDICPAGIDIERLLVKSNGIAVWGRK